MARHQIQRWITALLIAALTAHPGCSTIPTQQPKIDGTTVDITPDESGWIRLHAVPTWSNGQSPEWYLSFRADKPDGYLLFAYERGHGMVPVTFKKARPPFSSSSSSSSWFSLGGGPDPMGAGFLIMVALLIYGVSKLIEDLPRPDYPSPGCCFVWMEDAETGETVAGAPPWQLDSALPGSGR